MTDHQIITAERGRRAEDLRKAALAVLEHQTIAAGTLLDLDSDQVVAAGPKAAILMLLNGDAADRAAEAAQPVSTDLQQLKALALAAKDWTPPEPWDEDRHYSDYEVTGLEFNAAASPAVVLDLIARIESIAAPADAEARRVALNLKPSATPEEIAHYVEHWKAGYEGRDIDPTTRGHAKAAYAEGIKAREASQRAASPATASGDDLPESLVLDMARAACLDTSRISTVIDFAGSVARAAVSAATKPTADWRTLSVYEFSAFDDGKRQQYVLLDEARALLATKPVAALESIEQYRLQMAAISTAALGYWKESDGIKPEYDTVPLRDVAKLYAKYEALTRSASANDMIELPKLAWTRTGMDENSASTEYFYRAADVQSLLDTKPAAQAVPEGGKDE